MQAMIGSMPGGVPLEGLDAMFSCVGMDRSLRRSFHLQRELPNVDSPYCFYFFCDFSNFEFPRFLSLDRSWLLFLFGPGPVPVFFRPYKGCLPA